MNDLELILLGVAVVATAIVLGGMITFTGFFAPMVFRRLEKDVADAFMRAAFGPYYVFMAVFTAVGAAASAIVQPTEAMILGLVCAAFILARQFLMPQTQKLHDARERGEYGAAEEFARVHKRGAFLNMVQLFAVLVALLRLAV